jgi:hypothetical protein
VSRHVCRYCWTTFLGRPNMRYCCAEHARADAKHRRAVDAGRERALNDILRRMHAKAKA